MGTDKSQLMLHGKTFLERIASVLAEVTERVTLVGNHKENLRLELPQTPDIYTGWGALGGIHGALTACRKDWALVVACDLPFITVQLLTTLISKRDSFQIVVPLQKEGLPQPLCALYQVASCLKYSEQLIQSGEHRPLALLKCMRTRWVPFAEISHLSGGDKFFHNVNTPQDYALALE